MSYTWGATALPLEAPAAGEAVTDKALSVVAAYLKAFVNAHGAAAWADVEKSGTSPIQNAFAHNPEDPRREFNDKHLPALFLWRESGDDEYIAADWRVQSSVWKALWVFPPANQARQTPRDPFLKGLVDLVSYALKRGRDASYAVTGDSDTSAATVAALPTAIKTSIATSTSAQSYSGAALNGSIGGGAISPQRAPTVTMGGTLSSFVAGSTVTFTGLNGIGGAAVSTVTLGAALGTYAGDYDLAEVTSIAVDAQAGTAGTFTFGTAARTGLGSVMMRHAGLVSLTMNGYRPRTLPIQFVEGGAEVGRVIPYDAIEMSFQAMEKLEEDITDTTNVLAQHADLAGLDLSIRREDETEYESAQLDA